MKRTIASTIPLLALLVAAPGASAQELSNRVPIEAAKEQYRRAQEQAAEAFQKFLGDRKDGLAVDPQELRKRIRPLVEESFDARQRLQKAEVEALRRRLADIEQTIDNREKNKEAILDARIEDVLNGKVGGNVEVEIGNDAGAVHVPTAALRSTNGVAGEDALSERDAQREFPDFDLETRERLAKLDLQTAEEDYVGAERELAAAQAQYRSARAPYRTVLTSEKEQRHAAAAVERAKVKLDGLRRQRAELEEKADVAIAEASAEVRKASVKFHTLRKDFDTAEARVAAAEADVASAQATLENRQKQLDRVKELVDAKAIDMGALDEATEQLATAKARLDGAGSHLSLARSTLERSKATIDEAMADRDVADSHLRAARAQRERLGPHAQESPPLPAEGNHSGAANRE